MQAQELRARCKAFSLSVIRAFKCFPKTLDAQVLGKQLLRSATSVTANYRAACRARSQEEFLAKMSIVVEEADEVVLWLELIQESGTFKIDSQLIQESKELLFIMSASRKTAKANRSISKSSHHKITQ